MARSVSTLCNTELATEWFPCLVDVSCLVTDRHEQRLGGSVSFRNMEQGYSLPMILELVRVNLSDCPKPASISQTDRRDRFLCGAKSCIA